MSYDTMIIIYLIIGTVFGMFVGKFIAHGGSDE